MADVRVDYEEVKNLRKEIRAAAVVALGRLGERLYQHLRTEVPKDTRNLMQGVSPANVDEADLTAEITVSARSARTGGGGTVHYPSGKSKPVSLRPQAAFNYAEVVAKGRPAIRPKAGRALLIEVKGAPAGGAYISAGGKIFVVRTSAGAQAPNPYDERAADKLEQEAPAIVGAVFSELFT